LPAKGEAAESGHVGLLALLVPSEALPEGHRRPQPGMTLKESTYQGLSDHIHEQLF